MRIRVELDTSGVMHMGVGGWLGGEPQTIEHTECNHKHIHTLLGGLRGKTEKKMIKEKIQEQNKAPTGTRR